MPTSTDEKLAEEVHEVAENLAGFRVEVAEKFGAANARLEGFRSEVNQKFGAASSEMSEKFGAANARLEAFRFEMKERFGAASSEMSERFGAAYASQGTFRAEVETTLKFIRWIGVFFAGLLVSLFVSSLTVAWNASALSSDVKYLNRRFDVVKSEVQLQGDRLQRIEGRMERIEGRMDGIEKQLQVLICRTEPKAGG